MNLESALPEERKKKKSRRRKGKVRWVLISEYHRRLLSVRASLSQADTAGSPHSLKPLDLTDDGISVLTYMSMPFACNP